MPQHRKLGEPPPRKPVYNVFTLNGLGSGVNEWTGPKTPQRTTRAVSIAGSRSVAQLLEIVRSVPSRPWRRTFDPIAPNARAECPNEQLGCVDRANCRQARLRGPASRVGVCPPLPQKARSANLWSQPFVCYDDGRSALRGNDLQPTVSGLQPVWKD